MFKIYIKDFNNSNGVLVTEETLVQQIPAKDQYDLKLVDPKVKNEMGSSETLSFSIEPGTKFYDAFLQMKTYMRITYEDDTIFYGRVLTISNNTFRGTRQIRMEGPLAFLTDSPVEGVEESKRAKITTFAYMQKLINDHNKYCASEPNKKFMLGNVPGNYSSVTEAQQIKNDTQSFGSDSWTDTKSALEDLRSHYGGYFRTRAAGKIGKGVYLDWMNHYFNSKKISQKIEVGKNVLDISNVTEINNIFTAIIPIGRHSVTSSSNSTTSSSTGSTKMDNLYLDERVVYVPDIINQYSSGALNSGYHKYEDYRDAIKNYGIIIKPVTFQEANTKEKLRKEAFEWIKNNYQGGVTKFTIKAIDMHQIGDTEVSKIMIGDQVEIRYPVGNEKGTFTTKTITLTCLSIDFDLYHPENNSYTFGIPANMLTKTYGVKKAGSVNSGITDPPKATPTTAPDREKPWIRVVGSWLMNHKLYYRGPKPFVEDDAHRAQMYAVKDEDNQIYWPTEDKLYNAFVKDGSGQYIAGAYRNYKSENPPRVFDEETIEVYHVCEYVKYMYGIDLRTALEVQAPDITVGSDGSVSFWQRIKDAQDELIGKAKNIWIRFGELLSTHKLDVLGPDGQEMFSYMDADGNWHYYYIDPKTGEKVETNIRDLDIRSINTDKKVGWIVGESDNPHDAFGQMTLGIENYANGELVVARMSGELMYLGNLQTQNYTAVSLNHMDQVCGDFEYVTDPDTGIESIRVNSGGGMRVWHAKKNADGTYEHDSQGRLKYAEFGIYDDNTLTGGMITEHLADGSVHTKISGDIIDIEANQVKAGNNFANLEAWLNKQGVDINNVSGLLAEKIIAYEGTFSTLNTEILEAKNITSEKINAAFVGGATFEAGAIKTGSLIVNYPMGPGSIESISFGNGIKKLKIFQNGNNYTLKYLKNSSPDSDGNYIEIENGTFSRAVTSWNKGWSNGVLTITPIPQATPSFKVGIGKSWRTDNVDLEMISNGAAKRHKDSNNKYVAGQIECPVVLNELTGSQPNSVYEKDVTFSVSSILETITDATIGESAKTFTPSEEYIGIESIKVIPTHTAPTATALSPSTGTGSTITMSADGKTQKISMFSEYIQPSGSTSKTLAVKLVLGTNRTDTTIGRLTIGTALDTDGSASHVSGTTTVKVPVKVTSTINSTKTTIKTGTLEYNMNGLLYAATATSNGLVNLPSGYIGFKSVNVNVSTSHESPWGRSLNTSELSNPFTIYADGKSTSFAISKTTIPYYGQNAPCIEIKDGTVVVGRMLL